MPPRTKAAESIMSLVDPKNCTRCPGTDIATGWVFVTTDVARRLLEFNVPNNRKLMPVTAGRHATEMKSGDWIVTHPCGKRVVMREAQFEAEFDVEVFLNADELDPFVTWGTNPGQGVSLLGSVPSPDDFEDPNDKAAAVRALEYMGLEAGTKMKDIAVNTVFLGSCTNSRIEDLRAAAAIIKGQTKADGVRFMVVPGSAKVRAQAEAEGLDKIFKDFGAEWRFAGCSMCLGMNPDQLASGERAASTSNRNFEGRQGKGARTHLVSPVVAAATAIRGTLSAPADLEGAN